MNNKEIGQYLRQKRTEKKLTQAQLAKEFGVTYQAVSRWETGESIPDIETLMMIADYYEVNVDDILQRTKQEQKLDKWEDPTFTRTFYMKLLFAMFIFAHILGIGLSLAFGSMSGTLWQILAILCFVMFVLGSQFSLNVYFFAVTDKTKEEVLWYQRTYRAFIGILVFTVTIMGMLMMVHYYLYLFFVLILVLYIGLHLLFGIIEKTYNISPSILDYSKRRFFIFKLVLLLIVIGVVCFVLLTGYRIVEFSYVINIILIVLALL